MEQKYLYVVFTATPYKTGKFIRRLSGEVYNHLSIATEDDLRQCYAFGRFYYHTPFYAGFVTERPSRFCPEGHHTRMKVCRLPLTSHQWDKLQQILDYMAQNRDQYLYNYLSLSTALFHRKVKVKDAFTCAEFVVHVLDYLGFDFDSNRYYSISAIARRLDDYHTFTGEFPLEEEPDYAYFQHNPIPHPIYTTMLTFLALFRRKALA